eukprot:evm.model.scf_3356.3 EVM.evm.TU.scf_3356.3   scf_3356:7919-8431(+)
MLFVVAQVSALRSGECENLCNALLRQNPQGHKRRALWYRSNRQLIGMELSWNVAGFLLFCAVCVAWLARALMMPRPTLQPPGPKGKEPCVFTREEVAKHSTAKDAWIIIENKASGEMGVFDVTPYVEEHPGGEAIIQNAGGDATNGFYGPQHPPRAFDLIDDFYIGRLVE